MINVSVPDSRATVDPTVEAYIGRTTEPATRSTVIYAGGSVTVKAELSRSPTTDVSDLVQAVSLSGDTLSVNFSAIREGDRVMFSQGSTTIGGLHNRRRLHGARRGHDPDPPRLAVRRLRHRPAARDDHVRLTAPVRRRRLHLLRPARGQLDDSQRRRGKRQRLHGRGSCNGGQCEALLRARARRRDDPAHVHVRGGHHGHLEEHHRDQPHPADPQRRERHRRRHPGHLHGARRQGLRRRCDQRAGRGDPDLARPASGDPARAGRPQPGPRQHLGRLDRLQPAEYRRRRSLDGDLRRPDPQPLEHRHLLGHQDRRRVHDQARRRSLPRGRHVRRRQRHARRSRR